MFILQLWCMAYWVSKAVNYLDNNDTLGLLYLIVSFVMGIAAYISYQSGQSKK